ncbi:hypothetical protein I7I51_00077 [Histoplasma capsulatum]|uniref:Uncharacterized protein n=1 Tax=Ajellomyces capsulatus TaxID=5037 RepID=A0A8A1MAL2_AJECA|nr:hypothetical protein I7I51_00077 [Histoplasma capsulatum]
MVEPVPMEGFFNNIMEQHFSFVDEATYHMDNFREDFSSSGLTNSEPETIDPGFLENLGPKPVDALGSEAVPDFTPYPLAIESLSTTSPSTTPSLQHSATGMAPAELSSTPKESTGRHAQPLPAPPHSASGSAVNPLPKDNTNTACDTKKAQYDPSDAVNLDFFQPKVAAESSECEKSQGTDFCGRPVDTGEISDFGIGGNYSHHQSSYPSPSQNAHFSAHMASGESVDTATGHQPEMKCEDPIPTSPMSSANQGRPDPELQFSCVEEANAWRAFEVQVDYDPTIPKTLEAKHKIVTEMLKAMKSIEYAEDNEGMIRPFREQKHSPIRMEIVCWNILDSCISRHENGPLLAIYDGKAKTTGQMPTFKDRMDKIIECLWTQKTICKHLLDAYYLFTFVDDPVSAKNRVVANKNLNKRKGEVMNAGKKALGHCRTDSKSTPAKRTSEDREGLCTPFSTPRRDSPTRDTSTPVNINTNVRNMTLNSSPLTHSQGTHQMGFSSPTEPSTQDNMAYPMHHNTFSMAAHPQLINTLATGRTFDLNPMISSGLTGYGQPAFGFARSQSTNTIHGLGQNTPLYNNGPYNREEITEQFRQQASTQLKPAIYNSPGPNSNRRAMGPAPHPWITYQHATGPAPARYGSRNARSTEVSYGHGRKRSQDESDASDFVPSPQKKAR